MKAIPGLVVKRIRESGSGTPSTTGGGRSAAKKFRSGIRVEPGLVVHKFTEATSREATRPQTKIDFPAQIDSFAPGRSEPRPAFTQDERSMFVISIRLPGRDRFYSSAGPHPLGRPSGVVQQVVGKCDGKRLSSS